LEYGTTEPGKCQRRWGCSVAAVRNAPDQEPFLVGTVVVWGTAASLATEQPSDVPAWLRSHIGEGEGQIAQVVLQRARALYLKRWPQASSKIHAILPWTRRAPRGQIGESGFTRSAKLSGRFVRPHGSWQRPQHQGRRDFANGKECAREFRQCAGSYLTTAAPIDARRKPRSKLLSQLRETDAVLMRSFVQFDGEERPPMPESVRSAACAVLLRQIRFRWMPRQSIRE